MFRPSNRFTLKLFAAVLITSAVACTHPQYPEYEPVLERFGARLAEDVASDSIGAITAGVVVGDQESP